MPATYTLATTTLQYGIGPHTDRLAVASVTGILPGMRLYIDRECIAVVRADVSPWFVVRRGVDGTASSMHSSSATVWLAQPDQLYSTDPTGAPPVATYASPWINILSGNIWYAYGDENAEPAFRYWQLQTVDRNAGITTTVGAQAISGDKTITTG
jgi:hypothetical protein